MVKLTLIQSDCLEAMKDMESNSIDSIVTDPPYGYSFMGKDWDKAVPHIEIWKECLRILKDGSFAFIMSSPRLDVLGQMSNNLQQAGFNVGFTPIFWVYSQGFPKAGNIGKMVDKKLGKERLRTENKNAIAFQYDSKIKKQYGDEAISDEAISDEAKKLSGSFCGFQPKPAVEIIIVAMKPLSEKTYVEQALKNSKGITWLDDCRIPYVNEDDIGNPDRWKGYPMLDPKKGWNQNKIINNVTIGEQGRFPANLLVSDDVLNDGKITQAKQNVISDERKDDKSQVYCFGGEHNPSNSYEDSGSFSRYFDLDRWFSEKMKDLPKDVQKVFPFLIEPKADKGEKNEFLNFNPIDNSDRYNGKFPNSKADKEFTNKHPTIKPIQLMSYLITLGSRKGDLILDPFVGSGTTMISSILTRRNCIGIEMNEEYAKIAKARIGKSSRLGVEFEFKVKPCPT